MSKDANNPHDNDFGTIMKGRAGFMYLSPTVDDDTIRKEKEADGFETRYSEDGLRLEWWKR